MIDKTRVTRKTVLRIILTCCVPLGLAIVLGATLLLSVSAMMVDTTNSQIREEAAVADALAAGEYDCILVLGAGVRADGTASPMLADRLEVACSLYEAGEGRVPLLMSGDHSGSYNEVGVMRAVAEAAGVPSADIFLDHEGFSTYESLHRAREIYGVRRVIIVTQSYHLYRALHIARELGMDAVGVPSDLRTYQKQPIYDFREVFARFKAMFVAARGEPLGSIEGSVDLTGDGSLT